MILRRWPWHVIITLGLHRWTNNVENGMLACPWTNYMVGQHREWNAHVALEQHTQPDSIERYLGNTHCRIMSGLE